MEETTLGIKNKHWAVMELGSAVLLAGITLPWYILQKCKSSRGIHVTMSSPRKTHGSLLKSIQIF